MLGVHTDFLLLLLVAKVFQIMGKVHMLAPTSGANLERPNTMNATPTTADPSSGGGAITTPQPPAKVVESCRKDVPKTMCHRTSGVDALMFGDDCKLTRPPQ